MATPGSSGSEKSTPGKKVVPVFLALLIAVGAALYGGLLSLRPDVVDVVPAPIDTSVPAAATGAAGAGPNERVGSPAAPTVADRRRRAEPTAPSAEPTAQPRPALPGEAAAEGGAEAGEPGATDTVAAAPVPPPSDRTPGILDKETVMVGIRAVTPFVKECFEQGLKQDPSLAGKVVVHFEIEAQDGEGRITSGEVKEAETQSLFFEACVLNEVTKAKFEAPKGGGKVTVTYPFIFDPGGGFGGDPGRADDE